MTNFARGKLSQPISAGQQSIRVAIEPPYLRPNGFGYACIFNDTAYEIVRFSSISQINNNLVDLAIDHRGHEGSRAFFWPESTDVAFGITAQRLQTLLLNNKQDFVTVTGDGEGVWVIAETGVVCKAPDISGVIASALDYRGDLVVIRVNGANFMLEKYRHGDLVWSINPFVNGRDPTAIVIDHDNNIIVNGGDTTTSPYMLTKYSGSGEKVWNVGLPADLTRKMNVDFNSAIYYATATTIYKIDRAGFIDWSLVNSGIGDVVTSNANLVAVKSSSSQAVILNPYKVQQLTYSTTEPRLVGVKPGITYERDDYNITRVANGTQTHTVTVCASPVFIVDAEYLKGDLVVAALSDGQVVGVDLVAGLVLWAANIGHRPTQVRSIRFDGTYIVREDDHSYPNHFLHAYLLGGTAIAEDLLFQAVIETHGTSPTDMARLFVDTDNQCKVKFDNGTTVTLG